LPRTSWPRERRQLAVLEMAARLGPLADSACENVVLPRGPPLSTPCTVTTNSHTKHRGRAMFLERKPRTHRRESASSRASTRSLPSDGTPLCRRNSGGTTTSTSQGSSPWATMLNAKNLR
jgi:hypothetical protein